MSKFLTKAINSKFFTDNKLIIKKPKYLELFLILTPLLFFFIKPILGPEVNYLVIDNQEVEIRCLDKQANLNINDSQNLKQYKLYLGARDLYLSDSYKNILCFGYVGNFNINNESGVVEIYFNSNLKLFKFALNAFNLFLILLLLTFTVNKFFIFSSYVLVNYLIFDNFAPLLEKYFIFLPFLQFSYYETSLFVNLLFISIYLSTFKNNKVFILALIFHLIFFVDFVSIFLISKFFQNKFRFEFNIFEKNLFLITPVIHYFIKIISSLSTKFDFLWISSSQQAFRGLSRYPDFQWVLFALNCSPGKTFSFNNNDKYLASCDQYTQQLFLGNMLNNLSNETIVLLAIYVINIFLLFWIIIYYIFIKYSGFDIIPIALISISPPFIWLISYGNDDFIALIVSVLCLYNLKKATYFKLIILTLVSFVIIHSSVLLFSVVIISIYKKDFKIFKASALSSLGLIVFILYKFLFSPISIGINKAFDAVYFDTGYGILEDANFLSSLFYLNEIFIFTLILIALGIFYKSQTFKRIYSEINFLEVKNFFSTEKNLYFTSFLFYFLALFFISNNSYRLPIFFIIFIVIMTNSSVKVNFVIYGFLFFEPLIKESFQWYRYTTSFISTLLSYVFFCIVLKITYNLFNFENSEDQLQSKNLVN